MTASAVLQKQQQQREVKNTNKMTFWGFAWAWLALAGCKAIPRLLARFRDFERPEHAPRSPAGTHTCTVVYRRPPCVPRSRERKKRPAVCVYVLVRPFIMQVFLRFKNGPFLPLVCCDFIFEFPCTSVESYAQLYVKTSISRFSYYTDTTRTTHVSGTGTRYA